MSTDNVAAELVLTINAMPVDSLLQLARAMVLVERTPAALEFGMIIEKLAKMVSDAV